MGDVDPKEEAQKKNNNKKRVQLASNNDLYFLSPTEIFGIPMKMVSNASLSSWISCDTVSWTPFTRLLNPFFESPKN